MLECAFANDLLEQNKCHTLQSRIGTHDSVEMHVGKSIRDVHVYTWVHAHAHRTRTPLAALSSFLLTLAKDSALS